jgi:hypothetical protein
MAEYQKIEYRIQKDSEITETVVHASGSSCIEATLGMEVDILMATDRDLVNPQHLRNWLANYCYCTQ